MTSDRGRLIGERIQFLRYERGWRQKDLAKELNVSLKTVQSYEQGVHIPEINMIIELVQLFNVSTDFIIGLIRQPVRLDENMIRGKEEYHIPMEIIKIKDARDDYKRLVEFLKYTYRDKE